jgi:hypothetical protein
MGLFKFVGAYEVFIIGLDNFLLVNFGGKGKMLTLVLHLGYCEQECESKGEWRKVKSKPWQW